MSGSMPDPAVMLWHPIKGLMTTVWLLTTHAIAMISGVSPQGGNLQGLLWRKPMPPAIMRSDLQVELTNLGKSYAERQSSTNFRSPSFLKKLTS